MIGFDDEGPLSSVGPKQIEMANGNLIATIWLRIANYIVCLLIHVQTDGVDCVFVRRDSSGIRIDYVELLLYERVPSKQSSSIHVNFNNRSTRVSPIVHLFYFASCTIRAFHLSRPPPAIRRSVSHRIFYCFPVVIRFSYFSRKPSRSDSEVLQLRTFYTQFYLSIIIRFCFCFNFIL